jgi:hypothetical protein
MTSQTRASLKDIGNLIFDALALMRDCQIGEENDSLEVIDVRRRAPTRPDDCTVEVILSNGQRFSIAVGDSPDVAIDVTLT